MHTRLLMLTLISLFMGISACFSQTLNINETLQYISDKINTNRIPADENVKYIWQVNAQGRLTIEKSVSGKTELSQSVFLKMLDTNTVLINNNNDQSEYFYTIEISCVNRNNSIVKKHVHDQMISSIYIRLKPDAETARRLRNAIIYLVRKAHERPEYKIEE